MDSQTEIAALRSQRDALEKSLCSAISNEVRQEKRILELEEQLAKATDAMRGLFDEQNGPPLERRQKQWEEANRKCLEVLKELNA